MPFALKLAVIYIAINAAIMLVLSLNVIRVRRKTRTRLGDDGKPEMLQAIRAHANNTEYVPIALLLLFLAQYLGGSMWLIHAIGLPLTIGRIWHASTLLHREFWTRPGIPPGRTGGMILTQIAILVGIISCLVLVLTAPA